MNFFPFFSTARAITPHDTNQVPFRALYVGGTGNVTMHDSSGTSVVFQAVPVGTVLPVAGIRVLATGTTATLIVGLT